MNMQIFKHYQNPAILSWDLMAGGSLFLLTGAAMTKLHILKCLLCLVKETERWLHCVRPLGLMRDMDVGSRRLYLNSMQYSMGSQCS